ncbi:hypothetical protein DCAR_0313480 [Daucus carota subsp. sativus]|uniref:DUF7788 domain-containing protein n=1 Tax=Daucus carota subsp. sativus TaxID=79200 RepID=A0AAF1AV12_DAUCS|nr:hypothetical protein DCAR_0313480 [Daucus carota subsp. sativus]
MKEWRMHIMCTNPKLQKVEGEDLRSKVDFVRRLEVESNTDFQKVFDMIKKIFVFSDMEFDDILENVWETDYQAITRKQRRLPGESLRKYTKKAFGSCVPEIVFWNLADSKATPVSRDKPGVALVTSRGSTCVSGYSKNLMTLFLEDSGADLNPAKFMEKAIAGEEYGELVVLD